eukprot:CAMPEP_0194577366 /NCGR_PEP_ID=MMETSP0292-20121207/12174_1 /TAXON_ID=39354 /ORGANISM="Heterosigma akashiwo, Strain CCMP2393" /LENGTH=108 /DNA_ID=CAMNT_0039429729 /DNA_START=115 /DNA_END=442 /DNA_ORIENTATION=+
MMSASRRFVERASHLDQQYKHCPEAPNSRHEMNEVYASSRPIEIPKAERTADLEREEAEYFVELIAEEAWRECKDDSSKEECFLVNRRSRFPADKSGALARAAVHRGT